jgi:hypothetical protein
MSHAKRDTQATPANAPDLDEDTIQYIRESIRNYIHATMIQEDDDGNWVIDMVTDGDEE